MKHLTIFVMLAVSLIAEAQKNDEPLYYINSVVVPSIADLTYINPDNIQDIEVRKDGNGQIRIKSETDYADYLTVEDVILEHFNTDILQKDIFIKINGGDKYSVEDIRIDPTYFIYAVLTRVSDAKHLGEKYGNLVIIDIQLEREERKPQIRIRGEKDALEVLKP